MWPLGGCSVVIVRMYVPGLGFALAHFSACLVLVFYASIANKPAGSPFVSIFGIAGTASLLSVIFGVGFGVSLAPIDATSLVMATLCFPAIVILQVAVVYTMGDLLYYAGGSAEAKKPDFSAHSSELGLWVVVPLWVVSSSGQLLILLTTEMNPLIFTFVTLIVVIVAINFGYLRITSSELHELAAASHTIRFFKTARANKPGRGRVNDPNRHSNMAVWVFTMTAIELLHATTGLVFSLLLPPIPSASIAIALASRLLCSAPLLLWAAYFAHHEDTRSFFSTERGTPLSQNTDNKNAGSAQAQSPILTSAGKVGAAPRIEERESLLETTDEEIL